VAFGNVVGSNIANLGLVLGLVTLLCPVRTTSQFVFQEVPFMVFTGALLFGVARDGYLGRLEGVLFLFFLVLFLWFLVRRDRKIELLEDPPPRSLKKIIFYLVATILGIALLSFGADTLVEGAVGIARRFGISERIIGLTLVAVGTSLPELVSTLVAAYRRAG
jgi:cation:H+ antiporter